MPDKQKNVLELMSEMLQEQENNKNLCALKDISHNEISSFNKSNGDKSETENSHQNENRVKIFVYYIFLNLIFYFCCFKELNIEKNTQRYKVPLN